MGADRLDAPVQVIAAARVISGEPEQLFGLSAAEFGVISWQQLGAGLSATLMATLGARRAARAADTVPTIAAAADLNYALKEVADRFTKETGKEVRLSFGSSGKFTTQIRQGAPFALFLCADEEYVQALAKEGRTEGDGALYAIGRIGLFTPTGSPLKVDSDLTDLQPEL